MKTTNQRWRTGSRTDAAPSHEAMRAPDSRPAAGDTRLSVVVADDSVLVRRHLVALLRTLDRVRVAGEASDAATLLGLVDTLRPDVVVLDISMPGGNGIQALQHIKAAHPATLVIMLTNHSNEFYRKKCIKAGASFFFDKSSEFEKVSEVLESLAGPL